jgi:hypothetical protein
MSWREQTGHPVIPQSKIGNPKSKIVRIPPYVLARADKVSRIGVKGNSERETSSCTFRLNETDRKLGAAFESLVKENDK